MNKTEFNEKYESLLNEAQTALNNNDLEQSEKLQDQAKDLAREFENSAINLANQNKLEGNESMDKLENVSQTISGQVIENNNPEEANYTNAWAKKLLGQDLTDSEVSVFENTNRTFLNDASFTHTTQNTPTLIPDTVVAGIWKRAEEQYPLWADIRGFAVTGTLTFNKHTAIESGDAAWYDEPTATVDEKNTFAQLRLDGKELSKSVTVSWKMKNMAIPEFIGFLEQELAERIGVALGVAAYTGNGVDQPKGIKTALLETDEGKKQIITYKDAMKYADVIKQISSIHSSYTQGSNFYANNSTIWNSLANIVDGNGRPYFIPDTTSGGVGRLFGYTVKPDASIPDGETLFGNANAGSVKNQNAPLSITTETHAKEREDDYVAYTIVDADVLDEKAFAILSTDTPSKTSAK
ncbi:phage major capsid protein [Companilactobacillus metriopterae]|uniref:phage major capsid protein n=1 Tax=Companilactobacillus metriopterae TaxID=1909267 RepID=UPI00100AC847|nr:phage major capsid protein [Companilactobacillus metriopterae]